MARKQKSTTFEQIKRIKRTKRKKRDKREETWRPSYRSTIIRNFTSVRYVLPRDIPLSLSLFMDHLFITYRRPCSFEIFAKANVRYNIYTNDRNTSGTNKRNKGKRREWLVAEIVALHFSLTKIRVISSSLYILHSREIFYRSTPHLFYRPSAFPY